ncbi:hypothetical protein MGSAQ_002913 [marine sediment metagenome]|uniref:Uncharacterized protein n=1 Tax=marine sediment metagenome TaxID=412755 RepID=A0A1B6NS89_9ZZZZ
MASSSFERLSRGMMVLISAYMREESSACPEIISGVRASSIKIESISSIIQKFSGRCFFSFRLKTMLSRR